MRKSFSARRSPREAFTVRLSSPHFDPCEVPFFRICFSHLLLSNHSERDGHVGKSRDPQVKVTGAGEKLGRRTPVEIQGVEEAGAAVFLALGEQLGKPVDLDGALGGDEDDAALAVNADRGFRGERESRREPEHNLPISEIRVIRGSP